MKNVFCLFACALVHFSSLAQDYTPFPVDDAEWIIKRYFAGNGGPTSTSFASFAMEGDTLVEDTLYHKIYLRYASNPNSPLLVAGMREENKRVYYRKIGYGEFGNTCLEAEQEYLVYDFTLDEVGDSLYLPISLDMSLFVVQSIDSVWINDSYRTRWQLMPYQDMCSPFWYTYIEGIGSDRHPLGHAVWMTQEMSFTLSCYTHQDVFEYSYYPEPPLCDLADYVGIDEELGENLWHAYFDGSNIVWHLAQEVTPMRIELYTASGAKCDVENRTNGSMDVGALPAGIYMLRLVDSEGVVYITKVPVVK